MAKDKQCKDCGFLALRKKESRELLDAEPDTRDFGQVPAAYDDKIICFAQVLDIDRDACTNGKVDNIDAPYPMRRADVLSQMRECDKFIKWQLGLTPKERLQMELLDRQQVHQRWNNVLVALVGVVGTLAGAALGAWLQSSKQAATPPSAPPPAVAPASPTPTP